MILQGRIDKVLPIASGVNAEGKTWKKLEFLFEYYENPSDIYSRKICLSVMNDRIDQLDLKEGDQIEVRISLGCREFKERYYNDIRTGDVKVLKRADGRPADIQGEAAAKPRPAEGEKQGGEEDEVPF